VRAEWLLERNSPTLRIRRQKRRFVLEQGERKKERIMKEKEKRGRQKEKKEGKEI
jgi:hypothetical protein